MSRDRCATQGCNIVDRRLRAAGQLRAVPPGHGVPAVLGDAVHRRESPARFLLIEMVGAVVGVAAIVASGLIADRSAGATLLGVSRGADRGLQRLRPAAARRRRDRRGRLHARRLHAARPVLRPGLGRGARSNFSPRYRYTGAALTSDLAWLVGAGFAPLVALVLSAHFGLATSGAYLLSGAVARCARCASTRNSPNRNDRPGEPSRRALRGSPLHRTVVGIVIVWRCRLTPFVPLRVFTAYTMLEGAIEPKAIAKHAARARLSGGRDLRPQRAVRRDGLFGGGARRRACSRSSARCSRSRGRPIAAAPSRQAAGDRLAAALCAGRDRLRQSLRAGLGRASRPADRGGRACHARRARRAHRRADRADRRGRGRARAAARRTGRRSMAHALCRSPGGAVPRPALCRAGAARRCDRGGGGGGADRSRLCARLPLVATNPACFAEAGFPRRARRDAVHRRLAPMSTASDRRRSSPEAWLKPADEMARLFADLPEAIANTLRRRAALRLRRAQAQADPAQPRRRSARPRPRCCARDARGGADRAAARDRGAASGSPEPDDAALEAEYAAYFARLAFETRRHHRHGLPRLFPDRRRLHQMGQGQRHSGRPGPRFGRGLGGRLGADHHRSRSAAARPAVRALPQSRARVDARLRHRFLRNPARRGDPLRPGEIRPRPGRADHHLREAEGARGAARTPAACCR